jgi:hypothetical protein
MIEVHDTTLKLSAHRPTADTRAEAAATARVMLC